MKSWLYYFLGAGFLSFFLAVWRYRFKLLQQKYDRLRLDNEEIKRIRKLNREINENYQKLLSQREEQSIIDLANPDFWNRLRNKDTKDQK